MRTTMFVAVLALASFAPAAAANPLDALDAPTWSDASYDEENHTLTLTWLPPGDDYDTPYTYHLYHNGVLLTSTIQTQANVDAPATFSTYWILAEHTGQQSAPSTLLVALRADTHTPTPLDSAFNSQSAVMTNSDGMCEIIITGTDPNHFPFVFVIIQEECIPAIARPFHIDFWGQESTGTEANG